MDKKEISKIKFIPVMVLKVFFCLLMITCLSSCSTGFDLLETPPEPHLETAKHTLKHSHTLSLNESIPYRLKSALLFIKAGDIPDAQTILRNTQQYGSIISQEQRRLIREARLSLVKKEPENALKILESLTKDVKEIPTTTTATEEPFFGSVVESLKGMGFENAESQKIQTIQKTPNPLKIALILPSKGQHQEAAKIIRLGFLTAYYKQLKSKNETMIKLYETEEGSTIQAAYEKAIRDQNQMIVGPLTKPEVEVINNYKTLTIPVLALNSLTERKGNSKLLYQFGLMPEDEIIAAANLAFKHHHRKAIVLAPSNDWGNRLAGYFKHYWQTKGKIVGVVFFTPNNLNNLKTTVQALTEKHQKQKNDMVFLVASVEAAREIKPLLNQFATKNIPVYATSSVYTGTPSPGKDQNLNGVHFCDMPWILQQATADPNAHDAYSDSLRTNKNQYVRFFALGLDAYTLATHIASNEKFPNYGFQGYSGNLQINNNQRIQRELVCARFEHGIPIPD